MVEISAAPKIIYVSASEPSDKTEGMLWYDTTNDVTKISDGSSYSEISAVGDMMADAVNANRINIMINSIAASANINSYDDGVADIFTDADGADNTIDTGNTTAEFITDKYGNGKFETATGGTLTSGTQDTLKMGYKIHVNSDAVTLDFFTCAATTATKWYVGTSIGGSQVGSGNIISNVATCDLSLSANTDYYLTIDKEGASFDLKTESSASYPYNNTLINITDGIYRGVSNGDRWVINTIDTGTTPANKVMQTNALSITSDPVAIQVFATNSLAGSGALDYDFKIAANGWQTGKSLNTKYLNTDTGSTITLKLNLDGIGTGNTVEVENYAIFLYY